MRVEGRQGGRGHGVVDFLVVDAVDIVLVNALQDQLDLAPVVGTDAQAVPAVADQADEHGDEQADDDAQQGDQDGGFLHGP